MTKGIVAELLIGILNFDDGLFACKFCWSPNRTEALFRIVLHNMNGNYNSKDLVQFTDAAFSLVFNKKVEHFYNAFSQIVLNVEHYATSRGNDVL